MGKQRIEIEVDVPEGWEATGEWRKAVNGDYYIGWPGKEAQWLLGPESPVEVFILRKKEPVRESRWVNIYGTERHAEDRADADRLAGSDRLAIIRIDYEDGVPVLFSPEPLPGAKP